ncbi:MAG: hypothetical protein AAF900_02110 [Bacteroidota bacterium]
MQSIVKKLIKNEGGLCVSLILPTHYKSFAEKKKVQIIIKEGVHEVEKALKELADKKITSELTEVLHQQIAGIPLDHPPEGVGIFLTPGFAQVLYFPFPVVKKMVISDTFEIQDILYNFDKLMTYYVLYLNKNHTQLFKGIGTGLYEVVNKHFPHVFTQEYQDSRGENHVFHANDPSQVAQKRLAAFFREVHHLAAPYVKDYPLMLIGVDKYISYYKKADHHSTQVFLGELHASYNNASRKKLEELVKPYVSAFQQKAEEDLKRIMTNHLQRNMGVRGIASVLNILNSADTTIHHLHLVVERDFEAKGYHDQETGKLSLEMPTTNGGAPRPIGNIVEHILQKVLLRKDGKVSIVDPKHLQQYEGIVLMYRSNGNTFSG